MKTVITAFLLLSVTSCKDFSEDLQSFMPGTYARKVVNEYNKGTDTLTITELSKGLYRVNRTSSFQKIRNGKVLPAERKTELWICVFDDKESVLRETQKGKIISFLVKQQQLLVGKSIYNKIKS